MYLGAGGGMDGFGSCNSLQIHYLTERSHIERHNLAVCVKVNAVICCNEAVLGTSRTRRKKGEESY